jgi:hypothetical protein
MNFGMVACFVRGPPGVVAVAVSVVGVAITLPPARRETMRGDPGLAA